MAKPTLEEQESLINSARKNVKYDTKEYTLELLVSKFNRYIFDSKNSYRTTDELKKVLKSNAIMILYNFIEGVVSKSIEYIIDNINDNGIKYQELKPGLKHIMLKSTTSIKKNDFKDINMELVNL